MMEAGDYQEVDMGNIDQEDRPFIIIDKDFGKLYDIRNDKHIDRLEEEQNRGSCALPEPEAKKGSSKDAKLKPKK